MAVFDRLGSEYEQIVFGHDPDTGLRTIIAIYSTARGPALRGVAEGACGESGLSGRHVVVQGVGKVGSGVARRLRDEGARVTVADIDADAARSLAEEIGADVVDASDALEVPCDVMSPCA